MLWARSYDLVVVVVVKVMGYRWGELGAWGRAWGRMRRDFKLRFKVDRALCSVVWCSAMWIRGCHLLYSAWRTGAVHIMVRVSPRQ